MSDLVFTHFDPKLEILVVSDGSESGIGAVILQKLEDVGRPFYWTTIIQ